MASNDIGGVWRTIGGRRVFIKDKQSLSDAMKESGKFKIKNKKTIHTQSGSYSQEEMAKRDNEIKQMYKDTWEGKMEYKELHDKLENMKKDGKISQGELDALKYDASMETGDWKNNPKNANNSEYIGDNKVKIKEQNNWQKQIKENNAKMEKDVTDFQNKINEYRTKSAQSDNMIERYQYLKEAEKMQDKYYERFRENERANAKIKNEQPNEKYMQVDAYAGYKDKFNDTWGKDGSREKVVSAKMYTNDEFMEHLEDANWHSERKQLLEANLTNKELSYIKDRTKVSAWGVENLNGKEQVEKLIKEAKNQNNQITNALRQKAYQKYLKEHPASKMTFEQFKKMQ